MPKKRPAKTKTVSVPDPVAAARQTAAGIATDRNGYLDATIGRILRDAPWVDHTAVLHGIAAYHRDAMGRIPPAARYPEAAPWVEYMLAYERELRSAAHLDDAEIGLAMNLNAYLMFRGYRQCGARLHRPPQAEKCRVAVVPATDEGALWIKNVDDPPNHWHPEPPLPASQPRRAWSWHRTPVHTDGVGSGLHLDDEPAEIFPLPVLQMWPHHAGDSPGVVEFLRRYSPFWSGANLVVADHQGRTVAIEKCSRGHFETFGPDPECGFTHISGMVCRDPASPQGRYQQAKRAEYRRLFNLPDDGPDAEFWGRCDAAERRLVDGLRRLGPKPRAEDVIRLFWTPYPNGLCKDGRRFHADAGHTEYTLITHAVLIDRRQVRRWQRSQDCQTWPEQPEICQYG